MSRASHGPDRASDARWMRRALRLAARGFTHPNPMVGCILTRDDAIIGEGWHRAAGEPHAEAAALAVAGDLARGATAYVTLEPCAHYGRTPPCADALIRAGVARVVAACLDPFPQVAGRGLERLRQAGVQVDCGLMEAEARRLNEAFVYFHTTGRTFVTLKAAVTLDGKIATRTGDSRWVTGERARAYVHGLRARAGAVLCGVDTVLADDPLLTARLPGVPRQPLRVVLDSRLRTPPTSQIARTAAAVPTLLVCTDDADAGRSQSLEACGAEILRLPAAKDGRIPVSALLNELARRGVLSLLVEGGGQVHASFLQGGHAQRALWFIAPKLVGGQDAPGPVGGEGAARMADAIELEDVRIRRFGRDLLVEGLLDRPGALAEAVGGRRRRPTA